MGSGKDPLGILTTTSAPATKQDDPLGILKKKVGGDASSVTAKAGGQVGNFNLPSDASTEQILLTKVRKSPTTQADIDRQNKALGLERFDVNDPVKSYLTPLRLRKDQIVNKNLASESTAQNKVNKLADSNEVNNILQTEKAVTKELFPNTNVAKNWLAKHPASEDNETSKLALDVVNESESVKHFVEKNHGFLRNAAIDYAASKNDELGRQLKTITESGAEVPRALEGRLLS